MIQKSKLLLLLAWVLAVNAFGQIQQSKWYNFQPGAAAPACVSFTGSAPAIGQLPANSLTEYRGFNAAHTGKGELIFYVITQDGGANVYNAQGAVVYSISWDPAVYVAPVEIPIIKIGCGLEYHFIVGTRLYSYSTVDNAVMDITDLYDPSGDPFPSLSILHKPVNSIYSSCYAVKKIDDFRYHVYWLTGSTSPNQLVHCIVDASTGSIYSKESVAMPIISSNFQFNSYLSVMEVSQSGNYIAFADNLNLWVYNIQTNGSLGTLKNYYPFFGSGIDYGVAGIEFKDSKIYFTRFNVTGATTNEAVGYVDLNATSTTPTYISGTDAYSHSEIELGRDGSLYVTSSTQLVKINTSNNTFTTALNLNFYLNSSSSAIPISSNSRIRVLPDQIDEVDNSTGFSLKIGSYTTTRNETWTNGSNPFGVTTGESITVKNAININHEVIVTGMNFDFFTDAAINIGNGGRLILRSCNLKGFDCGKMWNGISITGNGSLLINDNYVINGNPSTPSTVPSSIADAKIAVKGIGNYFKAQIHQTNFLKNGKCIKFTNFNGFTDAIDFCTFDNTGLLKNQDATSEGINIPFYNGWVGSITMEFGWTSSGTWMFIGDNKIIGGTYGILSSSASFYVRTCEFKNMIEHGGIAIMAGLMGAPKFADIQDNKFAFVKKALRVESGSDVRFTTNDVQNTDDNAVELIKGRDCKYVIAKNLFNRCKNNAILLQDNAGAQSVASIDNNTILGMYIATSATDRTLRPYVGISVFEKGKVKGTNARTFGGTLTNSSGTRIDGLQITNNTMRAVTFGIKMSNVVGAQTKSPYAVNQTNIAANTIRFNSTFTPNRVLSDYNSAMELTLTDGIAITSNNIDNHDIKMNKIWNNKGVYLESTTKVLVKENTIKAGRGIGSNEMASDNNYTCNTLAANHDGISLGNHSMRAAGDVHGLRNGSSNIESRKNTFATMVNSEIELWTTPVKDSKGKIIITDIARMNSLMPNNQWIFYTGSTPKVVYYPRPTGSSRTIIAGFAKDICAYEHGTSNDTSSLTGELTITGDDVIDWQYRYEWIKEQKNIGNSQTGFISQLIDVQAWVAEGDYSSAYDEIGHMIDENIIEEYFKTVYAIIIQSELENNGMVDSTGITELIAIASQNSSDVGPAVYVARGVLWCQLGMEFATDPERNTPIAVQLKYENCMSALPVDEITAGWVDEFGIVYTTAEVSVSLSGTAFVQLLGDIQLPTDRSYAFTFVYQNRVYTSNYLSLSEWLINTNQQVELCALGKQGQVTGIDHQLQQDVVNVYPNPGTGVFTLEGTGILGQLATVVDVNGRVVYQATIGASGIDLTNKPEGMYYLRITDASGNILHRQSLLKTK